MAVDISHYTQMSPIISLHTRVAECTESMILTIGHSIGYRSGKTIFNANFSPYPLATALGECQM
jgi:hypothetical protein